MALTAIVSALALGKHSLRRIIDALISLEQGAHKVAVEPDFSTRAPSVGFSELEGFTRVFNEMLEQIEITTGTLQVVREPDRPLRCIDLQWPR